MGLILGIVMAGGAWLALWRTRRQTRASLQLLAAALLAGLAGYAFQGRTGLMGSPAAERAPVALLPAMPVELATEFFGRFNAAYPWLVIANSYMARGDSAGAVATLESAIRAAPSDAQLWIILANAMTIHAGGRISPAAQLAFRRSALLAPQHPGPAFFYGLTLLQLNQVPQALDVWRRLLANAPASSKWRLPLAERIAFVERLQARSALGRSLGKDER